MVTGLKFAGNSVLGLVFIFAVIASGFSASVAALQVVVLCAMALGAVLSYVSSRPGHKSFWLYGLGHIIFPALFIFYSSNGDAESTAAMRWSWFGMLSMIYLSSFAGGYLGYRRQAA